MMWIGYRHRRCQRDGCEHMGFWHRPFMTPHKCLFEGCKCDNYVAAPPPKPKIKVIDLLEKHYND